VRDLARLEDLLTQVSDTALRQKLSDEITGLKQRTKFGLVFEQRGPEVAVLPSFPVRAGSLARDRTQPSDETTYRVRKLRRGAAEIEARDGSDRRLVPTRDLHVVKEFGEPIYPALTPVGRVEHASGKPFHALIDGENFHTLQMLVYMWEREVDCIYIDPPYNTGARDWKYNNRYVDENDEWRHSKWLSFMDRRLRLAKRLLKPDGVLIVTIDEHEVHHLGMLLEDIFPDYLRHMISVVINPKGTGKLNFARVDEYAIFCVPNTGSSVIVGAPHTAAESLGEETEGFESDFPAAVDVSDDAILAEEPPPAPPEDFPFSADEFPLWERRHARRRGGESSYRHQRPNQFYPLLIDSEAKRVIRAGNSLDVNEKPSFDMVDGFRPLWPIDAEGNERCWRFVSPRMQSLIDEGRVVLGRYNEVLDTWTVNIWERRPESKKLKTVWWESSHDAGTHGTSLLSKMLGTRGAFPFPKSVYAVEDALAAVVRNRPEALIVDFFAGSATTFHATALLNAADGGRRRCILVTNNEVDEKTAKRLNREGLFQGDPKFERHGIFEQAARPRCEAVVTGVRPDGQPIPGRHRGGRPLAEGFEENIEFYRLDYLDPDEIELGQQFEAILPALWLAAGGQGLRGKSDSPFYSLPEGAPYGVLFEESHLRDFIEALRDRPDVKRLFLVTDSLESYSEMRELVGMNRATSMLYRDYLRSFRINTAASI
jgi:adenine-specific DNA-methyltransferase